MERFVHVSTHIEKTAGTSLQEFYTRYYGPKNVYIYSTDTDSLICADRLLMKARISPIVDKVRSLSKQLGLTSLAHTFVIGRLNNQNSDKGLPGLPANCSLIHGHFVADRFDDIVQKPYRSVVLRDPLERMISHYKYWKEVQGVTNHRIDIPFDCHMSFMDFQSVKCLQNFQSSALGSLSINDFDLVGVTQNLPDFVNKFVKRCPIQGWMTTEDLRKLNSSPRKTDYNQFGIDGNFIKKFKSQNELDYMNYDRALEMNSLNAL
jgi:hypothetical protein